MRSYGSLSTTRIVFTQNLGVSLSTTRAQLRRKSDHYTLPNVSFRPLPGDKAMAGCLCLVAEKDDRHKAFCRNDFSIRY